ncbi:MAG: LON peptidase substrate-binding domain-containing protein [Thalassovita sp.]
MTPKFALPDTIPIFPLPGALLLPRSQLPLHIFEPRYLAMLDDALKTPGRLIGMIQPCHCPTGGPSSLHHIGCAGRVTQFSETEDGRYMVTLTGVSRFRMQQEVTGFTPYRRSDVSWNGFEQDLQGEDTDTHFDRPKFMALLERFFEHEGLDTDWESLSETEDELMINSLAMILDFQTEDKQALLEAPCLTTRRETLVTLIEFALRGGTQEETLQ